MFLTMDPSELAAPCPPRSIPITFLCMWAGGDCVATFTPYTQSPQSRSPRKFAICCMPHTFNDHHLSSTAACRCESVPPSLSKTCESGSPQH
jgi:hypothetical protein